LREEKGGIKIKIRIGRGQGGRDEGGHVCGPVSVLAGAP